MCLFMILTGIPAPIHRYGYHGNRDTGTGAMVTDAGTGTMVTEI